MLNDNCPKPTFLSLLSAISHQHHADMSTSCPHYYIQISFLLLCFYKTKTNESDIFSHLFTPCLSAVSNNDH